MGKWKIIWHSLKKGIRVDLYDRESDPINRYDLAEQHPEKVEELGRLLIPFLESDGIKPPPVEEWVERSKAPKLEDERLQKRMISAAIRTEPIEPSDEGTKTTDGPDESGAQNPIEPDIITD